MSSSSRLVLAGARSLHMPGYLRGIRIRGRQIWERTRPGPGRLIDAVADDGTVSSVHEQREDRVHHVVVKRPATAGLVGLPAPGGELDLEEGTQLLVGLGDVEDEEVREDELGQRVRAIPAGRPVGLAVETVPERQVRVQPGP